MTSPRCPRPAGLTFINASMGGDSTGNDSTGGVEVSTLRIVGSHIAAVAEEPRAGDLVIDVHGDRILPGLINAHDHLQLNTLPCLGFGKRYRHVRDWISDINARRRADPTFEAQVAVARDQRLLIGGVKNLLSGVTTVAHHDPLYPYLWNAAFPTRIVTECGWSHSLYIDGEEKVRASHRRTPPHWPWMIHAAEGLDEDAAEEFERLDALGCVGPNTLLVHGVALDRAQRMRLARAAAGLIWCPSSNLRLFGKSAEVAELLAQGRVALGTDSRLSGARDLLGELQLVAKISGLNERAMESMVTSDSARLLRLRDRGVLKPGARADLLILPARTPLSAATRSDVRLVLLNGEARYGDKDLAQIAAPAVDWAQIRVDGRAKILQPDIADLLHDACASESGVEFSHAAWKAA